MKVLTSSIQIDLPACDFGEMQKNLQIFAYPLPDIAVQQLQDYKRGYANLHMWAKNNCDFAYYLHLSGDKCLYMGIPAGSEPPTLSFEDLPLPFHAWQAFDSHSHAHVWLKVLFAHFLLTYRHQVANESLYLYTGNRSKRGQTVLKVELAHHWQNRNPQTLEFFIKDKATRMVESSFGEWQAGRRKGWASGIPYEVTQLSSLKFPVFRQIKTEGLSDQSKIWVEDTWQKDRSKLLYHDLKSAEALEKSRVGLLYKLQREFLQFATKVGLAVQPKYLEMEQLLSDTKRQLSLPAKHGLTCRLLDGRIEKQYAMEEIQQRLLAIAKDQLPFPFEISPSENEGNESLPQLLLMDYEKTDFETGGKFEGETDPYSEVKMQWAGHPVQGLRVDEDWLRKSTRNPEIAIKQLYLKSVVTQNPGWGSDLPQAQTLEGLVFFRKRMEKWDPRFSWGYFRQGKWQVGMALGFPEAQEALDNTLRELTGRSFLEIWEAWAFHHEYKQEPQFRKGKPVWKNCDLVISKDYIWEVGELDERFLYDVDLQLMIQSEREEKRPVRNFLASEEGPESEIALAYNQFLRNHLGGIAEISFDELMEQYGKKLHGDMEAGFLRQVFDQTKESAGIQAFFRNQVGIEVYGKKATKTDTSLKLVKGIWYNPDRQQYFVGRKDGYKGYNQEKGFPMRQIICLDGEFKPEIFFPLLNVDFIRNEQFTVRPYPFALLGIWEEIQRNNS